MQRLRFFFRQRGWIPVSAIGVVLAVIGSAAAPLNHPNVSTISFSIAGSLLAAVLVIYLSPAGDEAFQRFVSLGIVDVYPSRKDVRNAQWARWVKGATQHCTLVGVAHHEWCADQDSVDALIDRVRHQVNVKIYFLDPNSDIAKARAREEKTRDTVNAIRQSISFMWKRRQELDDNMKGRFHLFVYTATLTGATWIDTFMIVTHYLAGFANRTSPALWVEQVKVGEDSPDLYRIFAENIRCIEQESSTIEIKEDNVNNYT